MADAAVNSKVAIDGNVERIRQRLLDRCEFGTKKYGVTTERTDLRHVDWLVHLQDELLDGAVYCERLIQDELKRISDDRAKDCGGGGAGDARQGAGVSGGAG